MRLICTSKNSHCSGASWIDASDDRALLRLALARGCRQSDLADRPPPNELAHYCLNSVATHGADAALHGGKPMETPGSRVRF
jgi:hypothetical protein